MRYECSAVYFLSCLMDAVSAQLEIIHSLSLHLSNIEVDYKTVNIIIKQEEYSSRNDQYSYRIIRKAYCSEKEFFESQKTNAQDDREEYNFNGDLAESSRQFLYEILQDAVIPDQEDIRHYCHLIRDEYESEDTCSQIEQYCTAYS